VSVSPSDSLRQPYPEEAMKALLSEVLRQIEPWKTLTWPEPRWVENTNIMTLIPAVGGGHSPGYFAYIVWPILGVMFVSGLRVNEREMDREHIRERVVGATRRLIDFISARLNGESVTIDGVAVVEDLGPLPIPPEKA
jgi:hypothetical protein